MKHKHINKRGNFRQGRKWHLSWDPNNKKELTMRRWDQGSIPGSKSSKCKGPVVGGSLGLFQGQRAGKHGWTKESKEGNVTRWIHGISRGSLEATLKSLYFTPEVMGSHGRILSSGGSWSGLGATEIMQTGGDGGLDQWRWPKIHSACMSKVGPGGLLTDNVNGWEKKRGQGCLQVWGRGTWVVPFSKRLRTAGRAGLEGEIQFPSWTGRVWNAWRCQVKVSGRQLRE